MKRTTTKPKPTSQPAYDAAYAACAEIAERLPRMLADHRDEIRTDPNEPAFTDDIEAALDHLRAAMDALGDVTALEQQSETTVLGALKRINSRIADRKARVHIACAIQDVEDWRNGKE